MIGMINWMCLICVTFLVLEIMVYFCKDAIKIFNSSKKSASKKTVKPRVQAELYVAKTKIAK